MLQKPAPITSSARCLDLSRLGYYQRQPDVFLASSTRTRSYYLKFAGLNQLEDRHISFYYTVTDKLVELHGDFLESLIVNGCIHVTDATFSRNFKLLMGQCCTIPFADHLTGRLPFDIGQKLTLLARVKGKKLDCMNIQHCPGISSSTVDVLVEQH